MAKRGSVRLPFASWSKFPRGGGWDPWYHSDMGRGRDFEREHPEWDAFLSQETRKAGERISKELERFRALGIIDADGNRIRKDLPPDMGPDSKLTDPDLFP